MKFGLVTRSICRLKTKVDFILAAGLDHFLTTALVAEAFERAVKIESTPENP